jgi:hypothetical protein
MSSSPAHNAELAELLPVSRLSFGSALAWLLAALLVGMVGSVLLESAHLVTPLAASWALLGLVPLEMLVYLFALRSSNGPALGCLRSALGVLLALALRGGLVALLAWFLPSSSAEPDMLHQMLFHGWQLWPATLVQVLALGIYLWLVRDSLVPAEACWEYLMLTHVNGGGRRKRGASAADGATGRSAERQKLLLAALLEPREEGQKRPPQLALALALEESAARADEKKGRGTSRRRKRTGPILPLEAEPSPPEETPGPPPALLVAGGAGVDDTAPLPVVGEDDEPSAEESY